jgi:hypothetical protein
MGDPVGSNRYVPQKAKNGDLLSSQARYRSKPIQQSVGKSIGDMLALPAAVKDKISVLLVSSPTCPPCHEALSEFLRENERWQLPFACITEADEAEYFQKFYDDYNRFVDIIPFYRKNLYRQEFCVM